MRKIHLLLVAVILFRIAGPVFSQEKLTNEKIWYSWELFARNVPGFNFMGSDKYYVRQEGNQIIRYDIETDESAGVLFDGTEAGLEDFDGFRFSKDLQKIVFETATEHIYRHSKRAFYHVYDVKSKQLTPVFPQGKQMYATLNPQGDKVAFVHENNLYVKNLDNGKITQITKDGLRNHIINGASDWVYEEELGVVRAYEWSPDGKYIAFYRFDESQVKEYTINFYEDDSYPKAYTYKYPKVGEKNSIVDIYIYDLRAGKAVHCNTEQGEDGYIAQIRWTPGGDLTIITLNRHQNHLRLLKANPKNGQTSLLLEEKDKYYVDNYDNLTFLPQGEGFLWTSDRSGYNHIYLYDLNGHLRRQLTKGNWEVTAFKGYDPKRKLVYFQSDEQSPLRRDVYSVNLKGHKKRRLTNEEGWNDVTFSPHFDYYILTHSTANQPPVYSIHTHEGRLVRMLEDNSRVREKIKEYGCTEVEFFDFTTSEGVRLNGWMIKPPLFNPQKKYPLFMYLYGGPGSQEVTDQWKSAFYWWFQMLAQKGYVVACVDNRGTGGRGAEFKKMIYLQLGKYETIDQIEAAKYLSELPYIDEKRTGIFGWSYGGYMSTLCLLKGNDVFETGIAVAPVTNWKWYDTIYTERFMRTESENKKGYHDNSPVYFADRLKGKYLLIHGLADDNVHYQNSAEMAKELVKANKQFEMQVYTNKNHSIYGGPTRLHMFNRITSFIEKNL